VTAPPFPPFSRTLTPISGELSSEFLTTPETLIFWAETEKFKDRKTENNTTSLAVLPILFALKNNFITFSLITMNKLAINDVAKVVPVQRIN
jgi:hypothetical protein